MCICLDDKNVAMIMTSCSADPTQQMQVKRQLKNDAKIDVQCPESVSFYNTFMRGVDRGDLLRGATTKHEQSAGNSTNIYSGFPFDTAVINSYILNKK